VALGISSDVEFIFEYRTGICDVRRIKFCTQARILHLASACDDGARPNHDYGAGGNLGGSPKEGLTKPQPPTHLFISTTTTTAMKTTALLLAAMPVLAHTASLSESPVIATKTTSSSLRGAASSALPSSSTTLPSHDEDAARNLQLQPDESCYYYGAPGQLTNVTCTPSLLGKCDQLMSSDCAATEKEAIDDATFPCTTFAVWYENSDSCAWAYVCCDNR
jgi:hypothetical protein